MEGLTNTFHYLGLTFVFFIKIQQFQKAFNGTIQQSSPLLYHPQLFQLFLLISTSMFLNNILILLLGISRHSPMLEEYLMSLDSLGAHCIFLLSPAPLLFWKCFLVLRCLSSSSQVSSKSGFLSHLSLFSVVHIRTFLEC